MTSNTDPIDEALAAFQAARDEVDRLQTTAASDEQIREAERSMRQARRRLMFLRVGATERSEYLEDTGAPPGSHEHKPPKAP